MPENISTSIFHLLMLLLYRKAAPRLGCTGTFRWQCGNLTFHIMYTRTKNVLKGSCLSCSIINKIVFWYPPSHMDHSLWRQHLVTVVWQCLLISPLFQKCLQWLISDYFNLLWPSDAIRWHRTEWTLALVRLIAWWHQAITWSMLTYHEWCPVIISWGQFHKRLTHQ